MNVVLILDDDPRAGGYIDRALSRRGYVTIVTYNVAAAQAALANIKGVRVIVADDDLGTHWTGRDFLADVKQTHPDILCVLTSDLWRPQQDREDLSSYNLFCPKPVNLDWFTQYIQSYMVA